MECGATLPANDVHALIPVSPRVTIGIMNNTLTTNRLVIIALLTFAALVSATEEPSTELIAEGVQVVRGAVNGVRIERNGKTLAVYGDPRPESPAVDTVLFTHHRRDVVWAGRDLVTSGAKAIVPAAELDDFTSVGDFWSSFADGRYHDYSHKSTKVLGVAMPVSQAVRGGELLNWAGLEVRVLDTPGYTPGAVSYLIDLPEGRVAFTGDLIYGDGKILDLYSLQHAIPELQVMAYHGYAARLANVIDSLQRIAEQQPSVLVPSRGPIIRNPHQAIISLISRARAFYANYLAIDAHHYYSGDDRFLAKARRVLGPDAEVSWKPFAETVEPLPPWIVPIDNARLILASDGTGFLVDCGSQRIIDELGKLRAAERLTSIEQIFVSHYHDDHTDQLAKAAQLYGARVYASPANRDILANPGAYRVPCLTKNPIALTDCVESGTRWRWKEFELTLYWFPGQALYHDALLVKRDSGEQYFFIGDSFTPSGIDDYCLLNRNLLQDDMGYFYCLNLIRQSAPEALLINQHVQPAFRFSPNQLDEMLEVLKQRTELLRDLLPWDDVNFGVDEGWARFYPYAVDASAGDTVRLTLRIMNHSPEEQAFTVTPHLPDGWSLSSAAKSTLKVAARAEGVFELSCLVPKDAQSGMRLVTADISWGNWDLRRWTEAMVTVRPGDTPKPRSPAPGQSQ